MLPAPLDPAARMLACMEPLRRPLLQALLAALGLPVPSLGLDVGCGIGLQAALLAQAVGPSGRVLGLDASASLLETARALTAQAGLAERVSFQQGSWDRLPYAGGSFDWVWSIDSAGYAPSEPAATVRELARALKPGGRLVLGFWSAQSLLPGHPALEARLNATPAGIAPFRPDSPPEAHYLNALDWLRAAGLQEARAETFVHTVAAPLDPGEREALAELFAMRWGAAEADVSPEDWREYLRLCRPGSPGFILDSPAYVAFFTYSIFSGVAGAFGAAAPSLSRTPSRAPGPSATGRLPPAPHRSRPVRDGPPPARTPPLQARPRRAASRPHPAGWSLPLNRLQEASMTTIHAFISRRRPLLYFVLAFAISWANTLALFGPGVFLDTREVSFLGEASTQTETPARKKPPRPRRPS